jgi:uncharacterized repeat protein (TIGR01451 family)
VLPTEVSVTQVEQDTPVPAGTINVDTTWIEAQSPYVINGRVTFSDGITLTIEPGVQVLLGQNASISVFGTLHAVGTAEKPIVLQPTSTDATDFWNWLEIGGGSDQNDSNNSRLSYVTIEGGAAQTRSGVFLFKSSPTLDHVTIRDMGGIGIEVSGGSPTIDTALIENNSGDGVFFSQSTAPKLVNATVRNNSGVAVNQLPADMSPTYRNLSFSGNGANVIRIETDSVGFGAPNITSGRFWAFGQAGVPIQIAGSLSINRGAFLSLEPGTYLQFTNQGSISVSGALYALGAPTAPITLSMQADRSGGYGGMTLNSGSRAILQHCGVTLDGPSTNAALMLWTANAIIQNCRIVTESTDALRVYTGVQPILANNELKSTSFGLRNDRSTPEVDARNTWWGDASGPYHPTRNTNGRGSAVSDGVLFDPWLRTPPTAGAMSNQVLLDIGGPERISPGQTVDYSVQYVNQSAQTVENAVLMLALPDAGEFLEDTGNGIFWPERNQVFWKLSNLEPGASGFVSVKVRYSWGLPEGYRDTTLALLGGTNAGQNVFDVRPYLAYNQVQVVAEQPLTEAEITAERQRFRDVDYLYVQAITGGFTFGSADRLTFNTGEEQTRLTLLKPRQSTVLFVHRQGDQVLATKFDPMFYTVRDTNGGLRRNLLSGTIETWGELGVAGSRGSATQAEVNFGNCFKNCVREKVPTKLLSKASQTISTILRGVDCVKCALGYEGACLKCSKILKKAPGGSDIYDVYKCTEECLKDPRSHVCTEDKRECGGIPFDRLRFADAVYTYTCDRETGQLSGTPKFGETCAQGEKCVKGPNGASCQQCNTSAPSPDHSTSRTSNTPSLCTQMAESGGACSSHSSTVSAAHDPNEKFGLTGNLLPGQTVPYTVTYENEGSGRAYGVFVVDKLSEHFDPLSIKVSSNGTFIPESRTIIWDIGELAPKGAVGATGEVTFTATLKRDLPSGATVTNQAVVHFPSVPEETPTNAVINMVYPIAGVPQTIAIDADTSARISLTARSTGNGLLTYALVDEPQYGTLSDAAPNLQYTPAANYSGEDRFTFTVSDGSTTSRPAEVRIIIRPSPNDTTPPEVLWTVPETNAIVDEIGTTALFTDSSGPIYAPFVRAQFSEAVNPATITEATVQLTDSEGRAVPLAINYDGRLNEITAAPHEPLRNARLYTLTIGRIKDIRGNALLAPYTTTFRTGQIGQDVYLPIVQR